MLLRRFSKALIRATAGKITAAILAAALALALVACQGVQPRSGDKLRIVATLFPQYDFARQIAGDRAEVTLLLPPGVESHTFDPRPADIVRIHQCDLFAYTGAAMEPWAARVLADAPETKALDLSQGIPLMGAHADEHEDEHEDGDADEAHEDGHGDPHIWLDPTLAKMMVDNLLAGMCEKDPANAAFYRENAKSYKRGLDELDSETAAAVAGAKRHTLVFGGRFAYQYFLRRYGLEYQSVFDSCAANAEPGARAMAEVIAYVKNEGIPCVYYEELADPVVARAIAEQTGASIELFSTAHNVTRDELESGVTFLDIMRANLQRIQKGLN